MAYPKISEHFIIPEFVPPEIWNQYGERSIWFVDFRLVVAVEKIRVFMNKPIFINTWHQQGQYRESGYRTPQTATGGKYSQHKFGRAGDLKITGIDYEEFRDVIRKHWVDFGITTIEQGTKSWLHIDIRNTGLDKLLEVPFQ